MAFADNKLVSYVRESREELKKVVWPTRRQATNHTLIVIGVSIFVAIFLGVVDYFLNDILEVIIQ